MNDAKTARLRKWQASGILKEPYWLERLDDPAPLSVVLELLDGVMERLRQHEPPEPKERPYD